MWYGEAIYYNNILVCILEECFGNFYMPATMKKKYGSSFRMLEWDLNMPFRLALHDNLKRMMMMIMAMTMIMIIIIIIIIIIMVMMIMM